MPKKGRPYLRRALAPKASGSSKHNIRNHRERLGWTQEKLSEESGMSVSAISAYERGADDPSLDALQAMADAMDIPRGVLLDVDPNEDPPLWASVLKSASKDAKSGRKSTR